MDGRRAPKIMGAAKKGGTSGGGLCSVKMGHTQVVKKAPVVYTVIAQNGRKASNNVLALLNAEASS